LYFVFSNVIETSSTLDLKILQDLLHHLTIPAEKLNTVMEIRRLCNAFIELYTDFTEQRRSNQSNTGPYGDKSLQDHNRDTHIQQHSQRQTNVNLSATSMAAHGSLDRNAQVDLTAQIIPGQEPSNFHSEPSDPFIFDQQFDWELFYQQPEVDMF
jgi:hypothetical protein